MSKKRKTQKNNTKTFKNKFLLLKWSEKGRNGQKVQHTPPPSLPPTGEWFSEFQNPLPGFFPPVGEWFSESQNPLPGFCPPDFASRGWVVFDSTASSQPQHHQLQQQHHHHARWASDATRIASFEISQRCLLVHLMRTNCPTRCRQ